MSVLTAVLCCGIVATLVFSVAIFPYILNTNNSNKKLCFSTEADLTAWIEEQFARSPLPYQNMYEMLNWYFTHGYIFRVRSQHYTGKDLLKLVKKGL